MQILVALLTGAIAGWIASKIMKSRGGLLRNILFGCVGGALGGWIASQFNLNLGGSWLASLLIGVGGACILILLGRWIFKK